MHFGAQSRGLRAPCERFAPWVTPGPRITRFRLAADLGRMGLDTHRVSNKVSKITSRHLVPLDRAFPAHALVCRCATRSNAPMTSSGVAGSPSDFMHMERTWKVISIRFSRPSRPFMRPCTPRAHPACPPPSRSVHERTGTPASTTSCSTRTREQFMALNVGSRLGHYDVTALIGEGGWARSIAGGTTRRTGGAERSGLLPAGV